MIFNFAFDVHTKLFPYITHYNLTRVGVETIQVLSIVRVILYSILSGWELLYDFYTSSAK